MSTPWLKFYPSDWRADPALRMCSLAARGLWMEMLCLMHEAEPRGSLLVNGKTISEKQLASLVGCPSRETVALISELEEAGVFSRAPDGTIFSRRIRRDAEKAAQDRESGMKGGAPNVRRGSIPKADRVRPYRKSDSPEKTARIFAKTSGLCFWCDSSLVKAPTSEADFANGFHVDHLTPVCDGGTNDEDNLVPSCAVCNHDRSKVGWPHNSRRGVDPTRTARVDPTVSGVGVGHPSDNKAQKPEARSQSPEHPTTVENGRGGKRASRAAPPREKLSLDLEIPTECVEVADDFGLTSAARDAEWRAYLTNRVAKGVEVADIGADFRQWCGKIGRFGAAAPVAGKPAASSAPMVRVQQRSEQGRAWEAHYRAAGKRGVPWNDGAWRFPTEWPPGVDPPAVGNPDATHIAAE